MNTYYRNNSKSEMLQYHYTWGDESIDASSVKVIKREDNRYITIFEQEGFSPEYFYDLTPQYGTLISKETENEKGSFEGMTTRIITMITEEKCNPKPEDVFRLIHRDDKEDDGSTNNTILQLN